jgi:hypothetical protein
MAEKDINQLLRAGAKAVAAEFVEAMREQRPTLTLPQLRYIDVQVQSMGLLFGLGTDGRSGPASRRPFCESARQNCTDSGRSLAENSPWLT